MEHTVCIKTTTVAEVENSIRQQVERDIITALFMSDDAFTIINYLWDMELNFDYKSDPLDDPFPYFDEWNYGALFSAIWQMKANKEGIDPVSVIKKIGQKHNIDLAYIQDIMRDSTTQTSKVENVAKNALILQGMYYEGMKI